jgi:1,4-dihydroxy-2-naphthoate polyprenyltransferase
MPFSAFFSLVEIKTKAASVVPFLTGTLYALYRYRSLHLVPMALFFLSMIAFDMFTTGLNNRQDYMRANKKEGYNYERHNAIVRYRLSRKNVDLTLGLLFILAVVAGIELAVVTDWLVLLMGAAAFMVGLLYSTGPVPVSRTPLGEAASGIAMGFGISFLSCYVQLKPGTLFSLSLDWSGLNLGLPFLPLLGIASISVPCICCIANIMLANNLCDMDDDLANHRYTLPVTAGKKWGMSLLHFLYLAAALAIPFSVVIGAAPLLSLASLVVIPKIWMNLAAFRRIQTKKDTFSLSVQNFYLLCLSFALTLGIGSILNQFA